MKKLIFLILIFSFQAKAEIVTATGTHKHTGNFSPNESCSIALEKAKLDAMRKVLGESISSEVFSSCSEVDGELNCERNQFSLLKLRGDIVDLKTDEPVHDNNEDAGVFICKQTIEANVLPIRQNTDPSFQFDVKLNERTFRSNETMEIKINTSKKMYITIFQWLPYGGTKYNKITKIFPNEKFNKNTNNLVLDNISLKYGTYFPDEIDNKIVDEHLIFVASLREIPWLNEYATYESLKKQFIKSKTLLEIENIDYIIVK